MVAALVLVLAMTATTFTTQRQLMSKNMPKDALSGPYAQQQKMLLYVLPVVFAVGGIAFPIGVLLYWTTSNLWTMGQQFYVIRNNPAPGTPASRPRRSGTAPRRLRKGTLVGGRRRGSDRAAGGAAVRPVRSAAPEADARAAQEDRQDAGRLAQERPPGRQEVTEESDRARETAEETRARGRRAPTGSRQLEHEGDIAADYLEELLDIADLDGDLDMDVEGDRAAVSIVGADLSQLVGANGEVLEALQELTRLAVYRETGERSRLMLDISGYRADRRTELEKLAEETVARVKETGEPVSLDADVARSSARSSTTPWPRPA